MLIGSGKGTLARLISDHYGFAYLDTGTLYRGVAWLVLHEGGDPADPRSAVLKVFIDGQVVYDAEREQRLW